jgi:hypothetical protein
VDLVFDEGTTGRMEKLVLKDVPLNPGVVARAKELPGLLVIRFASPLPQGSNVTFTLEPFDSNTGLERHSVPQGDARLPLKPGTYRITGPFVEAPGRTLTFSLKQEGRPVGEGIVQVGPNELVLLTATARDQQVAQ